MKDLAPIAVFAFNRPEHLERLFASLDRNPETADSPFYLFCDGPRGVADETLVRRVHDAIDRFARSHRAVVEKRALNLGLAASITAGIAMVLQNHDRFIVLEDDLVLSPQFLRFMNEALTAFKDQPEIGCVSGYMYPVPLDEPKSVLLPFVTSWRWGTWGDRWERYNPNGRELARRIKETGRRHAFNLDDSFHCWGMLQDQVDGWNSSWWIRWYASLFLEGRLSVWPGVSLLMNEGMDGSGTHCGAHAHYQGILGEQPIEMDTCVDGPSMAYMEAIKAFLRPTKHSEMLMALRRKLPRKLFKVLRPAAHRVVSLIR
ncbi:MAG: glycosyltransferase family A protein [Candidatus Dormibacteraceae bacterium]